LEVVRKQKANPFTDNKGIGKLKLKGIWDLNFYQGILGYLCIFDGKI
jgi:hypothetical protein